MATDRQGQRAARRTRSCSGATLAGSPPASCACPPCSSTWQTSARQAPTRLSDSSPDRPPANDRLGASDHRRAKTRAPGQLVTPRPACCHTDGRRSRPRTVLRPRDPGFTRSSASVRVLHAAGTPSWPRGRGSVGRASPCQGEGRGFESRRPLGGADGVNRAWSVTSPWPTGGVAEWLRQGPAKPCTRVRFPPPPRRRVRQTVSSSADRQCGGSKSRAFSSAGERFPDTEEVTGSIPVTPTSKAAGRRARVPAGAKLGTAGWFGLIERQASTAAASARSRTSSQDPSLHRRPGRACNLFGWTKTAHQILTKRTVRALRNGPLNGSNAGAQAVPDTMAQSR
jgi:hypothetical protein